LLYTEDFKKQVVKKLLSPGVRRIDLCRKLKISENSIDNWKRLYADQMRPLVQELDVEALLYEPPVDLELLLEQADRAELAKVCGSQSLALQVDEIRRKGKTSSQYTDSDKYAVVTTLRSMATEHQGIWMRQLGLQGPQIRLWEEQLIAMSKKPITTDRRTAELEDEIKQLKRKMGELERDNRELKLLIELKKKYPTLFQQDEGKS